MSRGVMRLERRHAASLVAGTALLCAVSGLLGPTFGGARARAQTRPNVVLIVADDLGTFDLGSYGQQVIQTPALDAFAAGAARFEAAYTTVPVCAPSRCSLLTGLHAGHCVVFENDDPNLPLSSRDPTIAELLSAAGYRSAITGKWALGGELEDGTPWNMQSAPWRAGFADVVSVLNQQLAQEHYPAWLWAADATEAPHVLPLPDNREGARGTYAPDLFAAQAQRLIAEAPEPFFLYVPSTLPHRELLPPPGSDADPSDPDAAYRAMVERLDQHVGALLAAIEARGIAGRTLVVFTSDNGPTTVSGHRREAFASAGPLRGQKRDLYEGGVRVPLLVRGPGIAARVLTEPVMLADLLPTFTALGGAQTPPGIDGRSLVPVLLGPDTNQAAPLHDHLYFECNERRGGAEPVTRQAVRAGRWKWIRSLTGQELYDLEADPIEARDLAAQEPDVVARLAALASIDEAERPPARAPLLDVRANGLAPTRAARTDGPTPLLVLIPGDVEDDGHTWPQRLDAPALQATLVGAEVVRGEPAYVRFEGTDHVVLPSHPALAVLGESFSMRARVRLRRLAAGPDVASRQWLVLAKGTGTTDVHASFGLLVQGGDLGCTQAASRSCTGREIVVYFGDPRLDASRAVVLASSLRIEDEALHDLRMHVDRERAELELVLDGRREIIPFLARPGVASEAPIVLGSHHDEEGRFDQGFVGELYRFALTEGRAHDDDLTRLLRLAAPRHVRVDLGPVEQGAATRVELDIRSVLPDAHWARMEVVLDEGVRAQLEGQTPHILFGAEEARVAVRLDTTRLGRFEADLTVRALRGRTGTRVEGAPVRVHIGARIVERVDGHVEPAADAGGGQAPWVALSLIAAAVLSIAGVRWWQQRAR